MSENFVGRKTLLEILEKRARDLKLGYRQNIAILGDEAVGKTTLVFEFLNRLCDTYCVPVYIEVRPESLSSFVRRFCAVLLYNFMLNSQIELKEELEFLLRSSDKYLPRTTAQIKNLLSMVDKRKKNNVFGELLLICDTFYLETGKHCIVIFDEFTNLESIGVKDIFSEWSRILVAQKNTLFIITSSCKSKAQAILAKNLSLLFGNFEVLSIEPFDTRASHEYLSLRLPNATAPGLKEFIIHFTGGCPFYLGVISDALANSGHEAPAETLEGMLFESSGILNQRFSNYFKRFLDSSCSQDLTSLLYLIASGQNKIKDIAHIMRKSQKELSLRITQLLEMDAISRSADFLKINDRVFAFWLKFVYQNKLRSLTFDAKNQKALFRENIDKMIQEFIFSTQKPVVERMAELLRLFADETVQVERKRLRLAQFREIKSLEFDHPRLGPGLIGRSTESLWIVAFKPDLLTEEDVTEFARECKKYRQKLPTKIIISLKDIDTNARLRAMEEKIMTWDINRLNQFFDLYSRPRVITV